LQYFFSFFCYFFNKVSETLCFSKEISSTKHVIISPTDTISLGSLINLLLIFDI